MDINQTNKAYVWDFWQKLETASNEDLHDLVRSYTADGVCWHGPDPINCLTSRQAFVDGYLIAFKDSFSTPRRSSHIFMGGESHGKADGSHDGQFWVGGTGLWTGTFVKDWLGIPANNQEVSIRWGEFCLMQDGKIAEVYFLLDLVDLMQQAGISVLPPARGQDHIYPAPAANDGIMLAKQPTAATNESMRLIREFLYDSLNSYDSDAGLKSMGVADYFTDSVQWYGPGGIGACLSLSEFQSLHQQPWLNAFPDRQVADLDNLFAEGDYSASSGWKAVTATHDGDYLGTPATGKTIHTNGIDFWKRDGDKYIENWVFVDMIHLFRQFGVDLMARINS